MTNIIKNALLAGLGIASLGRKKFLKVYESLIVEGERAKGEGPLFKSHLPKIELISEKLEDIVAQIMQKANLATRSQIEELNKKIDKLLKEARTR